MRRYCPCALSPKPALSRNTPAGAASLPITASWQTVLGLWVPAMLATVIWLIASAVPARAQSFEISPNIYRVQGVPAEAEAATATLARGEAVAQGQITAFDALVARLTLPDQRYYLAPTAPEIASSFVTALEVPVEQTTPTRWIGELNVSFDPTSVRNYLRGQGVIPIESLSRPGVVIPILNAGDGGYQLWDAGNEWLTAWQGRNLVDEQAPIIAPLGDAQDRDSISAREADELNRAALSLFAARYGVERVYIARAFVNPTNGLITGQLQEVDFGAQTDAPIDRARAFGGEYADLRDTLATGLVDQWKSEMAVTDPRESEVDVTVLFDTHAGWLEMQSIINQSGLIVRRTGRATTTDGALMTWRYLGEPFQLQRELNEIGAILSLDGQNRWQVQTLARQTQQALYTPPAGAAPVGSDPYNTDPYAPNPAGQNYDPYGGAPSGYGDAPTGAPAQ